MRTLLLAAAAALVTTTTAQAVEIRYPRADCATVLGTDLSTPGADSSNYVFEMLCKDAEGNHVVLVATWATAAAFLGFGRKGAPERITLTPADVDALEVIE
jgi:hypothetical protein